MTSLTELRALVEQAREPWFTAAFIQDDGYLEKDAAFIAACSPDRVLWEDDKRMFRPQVEALAAALEALVAADQEQGK